MEHSSEAVCPGSELSAGLIYTCQSFDSFLSICTRIISMEFLMRSSSQFSGRSDNFHATTFCAVWAHVVCLLSLNVKMMGKTWRITHSL